MSERLRKFWDRLTNLTILNRLQVYVYTFTDGITPLSAIIASMV